MRRGPERRSVSSKRNPARVLVEGIEDAAVEGKLKLETAASVDACLACAIARLAPSARAPVTAPNTKSIAATGEPIVNIPALFSNPLPDELPVSPMDRVLS